MHDKMEQEQYRASGLEIAIIGMAGRFPGAGHIDEFWENLKNGKESIKFFTDEELINAGVSPAILKNPNYVKAKGIMAGIEYFDAAFFGYLPPEAEVMDPQMRIFHESLWEALEDAGYDPGAYEGAIGLYAGASANNLWIHFATNLVAGMPEKQYSASLLYEKDLLCTRVSYKLNLKGPSYTLHAACSTALVAVHEACQGLLSGECKMALAGGVTVTFLEPGGYLYQEGMIDSPDGRIRAFDAGANGTVFGNGVGAVVLKTLEDAWKNRDHIYAIIKGSAINNDGNRKVGYTAPSINGQAEVIRAALRAADVEPESIGYIETHGTGTPVGDPIEIKALTKAFNTRQKRFCPIGSVKTNVGHLDIAAGITGFIKTVMVLKHQLIPPSLNFHTPNPEIDFDNSPFYVNTRLTQWKKSIYPRRAGVSSFGIGGTNAHVILEEAPPTPGKKEERETRDNQLIILSAKTETALDRAAQNLARFLGKNPQINLADVAYTLQTGRNHMEYRKIFPCSNINDAIEQLSTTGAASQSHRLLQKQANKSVIFMFPGQGSQYVDMAFGLFLAEPVFREEMSRCLQVLKPLLDYDVIGILYPKLYTSPPGMHPGLARGLTIDSTAVVQPLLFMIEYALARLMMHWGIAPDIMIGHSIGEYTAACLAGVFSLEDALKLVALRGKWMQQIPPGAMTGVPLPEEELTPLLQGETQLALAAVNAPDHGVVSGPLHAIDAFEKKLKEKGHETTRLHTSHAFHSPMMDPVVTKFRQEVAQVQLNEPKIPFISNVTGEPISNDEAISPDYWAKHLRKTVRFAHGMNRLLEKEHTLFLEVGPGRVLTTLTKKQAKQDKSKTPAVDQWFLNLMRHPYEVELDTRYLLTKIGQMWLYGKSIDWATYHSNQELYRVSLPTYPFERKRYWAVVEGVKEDISNLKKRPLDQWFYFPAWKRTMPNVPAPGEKKNTQWLVFIDTQGIGSQLARQLEKTGAGVITVEMGPMFGKSSDNDYTMNPNSQDDYDRLFKELTEMKSALSGILYLWNITGEEKGTMWERVDNTLETGFYGLISIVRAVRPLPGNERIRLRVVTDHMMEVTGGDLESPLKAVALGLANVINPEFPHLDCRVIDVELPPTGTPREQTLLEQLLGEVLADTGTGEAVAFREGYRWEMHYEPIQLKDPGENIPRLKEKGVYLITGGLGGIGLVLAEHLVEVTRARLVLTGHSSFPDREQWDQWLDLHTEDDPTSIKINRLKKMQEQGAEIMAMRVNVTDAHQVRDVITRTKERFGALDGVIHSAGVADGALILRRTREFSQRVLAPKVKGTLVLADVLQKETLDFFIICSSTYSVLGGMGQAAYCAANAFIDAFAFYNTRKQGNFTISLNWDGWEDVGMVVNANRPKFEHKKAAYPFFDKYIVTNVGGNPTAIFSIPLKPREHWFLDEHRTMGSPFLVGTSYLEFARAAFELHQGARAVEIRNHYFLGPLLIGEKEERTLLLVLTQKGDYFEYFFATPPGPGGRGWQPHARGDIAALDTTAQPPGKYDIHELKSRCNLDKQIITDKDWETMGQGIVFYGPHWNCMRERYTGKEQVVALLQLNKAYEDELDTFKLHPSLLDISLGVIANINIEGVSGGPYLPFSYKRLRMSKPMPVSFYSYSRFDRDAFTPGLSLVFNVTIVDEQGDECLQVENFTIWTIQNEGQETVQKVRQTYPPPTEILASALQVQSTGNPAGNTLGIGILPVEGNQVFDRVLGSQLPQVITSTRDFIRLKKLVVAAPGPGEVKPSPSTAITGTSLQRPELSSVYQAPRNEIEKKLAETMESYFGIDRIGVHDNFFELGATSLDFAQVIGPLAKALEKDIPLVAMFSYPTIADLGEFLVQEEKTLAFSREEQERLEKKDIGKRKTLEERRIRHKRGGKNE